jgi:HSP20 family protein
MAAMIPEFPSIQEGPGSRFRHNFTDTFGQHMFHSHNAQQAPSFDISETDDAYLLDGDFPGLEKKSDISLRWSGKRTLIVEANVPRPDYETLWQCSFGHSLEKVAKSSDHHVAPADTNGTAHASEEHGVGPALSDFVPSLRRARSSAGPTAMREWVRERHTGKLYRTFTFPDDVETSSVKAILHQGQLNLMISKSEPLHPGNREIVIDDF